MTRFAGRMEVLNDDERFSSRAIFHMLMAGGDIHKFTWGALGLMARWVFRGRLNALSLRKSRSIAAENGECHSAMRAVANRGFTPSRVAA